MGQQYMQKFEYRSASKSDFDQAWAVALQTFAQSGNWGGAEAGVRHIKTYGTAWGGYVLIDVDDAGAFARYQLHHGMNYGHMVHLTFEPVYDLDAALGIAPSDKIITAHSVCFAVWRGGPPLTYGQGLLG
jgi:hypothetical protein